MRMQRKRKRKGKKEGAGKGKERLGKSRRSSLTLSFRLSTFLLRPLQTMSPWEPTFVSSLRLLLPGAASTTSTGLPPPLVVGTARHGRMLWHCQCGIVALWHWHDNNISHPCPLSASTLCSRPFGTPSLFLLSPSPSLFSRTPLWSNRSSPSPCYKEQHWSSRVTSPYGHTGRSTLPDQGRSPLLSLHAQHPCCNRKARFAKWNIARRKKSE